MGRGLRPQPKVRVFVGSAAWVAEEQRFIFPQLRRLDVPDQGVSGFAFSPGLSLDGSGLLSSHGPPVCEPFLSPNSPLCKDTSQPGLGPRRRPRLPSLPLGSPRLPVLPHSEGLGGRTSTGACVGDTHVGPQQPGHFCTLELGARLADERRPGVRLARAGPGTPAASFPGPQPRPRGAPPGTLPAASSV